MGSYTMQNRSLQVRDGDMPLLPFQSGCKPQIQTVRTHTCVLSRQLCPSVAIQIRLCYTNCHCSSFSAILGFPTLPRATIQLCWTNRAASWYNDSHDPVMYGCETRTSITVVSKFPRKTWGAGACANSGYQALFSDFFQAPGNEATPSLYSLF